jgi:hypothetical protein
LPTAALVGVKIFPSVALHPDVVVRLGWAEELLGTELVDELDKEEDVGLVSAVGGLTVIELVMVGELEVID